MARKFFFVTDPNQASVTLPLDWNSSDNEIHCIGAGGGGNATSKAGGGGGAWKTYSNAPYNPNDVIQLHVGAAGASGSSPVDGEDTWVGGASIGAALVGAKGGNYDRDGTGGLGGDNSGPGSSGYKGGNGGPKTGNPIHGYSSGGAGGAGGPNGAGGNGGFDTGGNPFGPGGGTADGGVVAQRGSGSEWSDGSVSAGSGAGACGQTPIATMFPGSNAGNYGGGGSASPSFTASNGLIVFGYEV